MVYLKPLFLLWPIQMHPLLEAHLFLIFLRETSVVNAVDQGSVSDTVSQLQPKSCACITHIFGVGHRLCLELEEGWVRLHLPGTEAGVEGKQQACLPMPTVLIQLLPKRRHCDQVPLPYSSVECF